MKKWYRLHLIPVLRVSTLIAVVTVAIHLYFQRHFGHKDLLSEKLFWFVPDAVMYVLMIFVLLRWTTEHSEHLSHVDAYQAHTYFQNLKVNNALTKLQSVIELCDHGDHSLHHEGCKAVLRKQMRVIQSSMGKGIGVLSDTEYVDPARSQAGRYVECATCPGVEEAIKKDAFLILTGGQHVPS